MLVWFANDIAEIKIINIYTFNCHNESRVYFKFLMHDLKHCHSECINLIQKKVS